MTDQEDLKASIDWLLSADAAIYPTVSTAELTERLEVLDKSLRWCSDPEALKVLSPDQLRNEYEMVSARIAALKAEIKRRAH